MFDDLHDPDPPTADMATLAAISSRARRMRQRRMAVAGGVAAGLVTVVGVVAVTRDDDPGRIAITDSSITEVSTPPLDCPAVGLTYVGAGISVALIQDPVLRGVTMTTDDPGPIHAERAVTVDEGDLSFQVGRGLYGSPVDPGDGAKDAGTVTLPNGRERRVVIGVTLLSGDDNANRLACILESAVYDPELDIAEAEGEQPGATSEAPQPTTVDTDPPAECPAVGLTYLGAGLSAALIQDPVIVDGFVTDDPGPIHAERSVTIDEDGTTISIGRFFTPPSPEFVGIVETDDGWVGREDKGRAWVAVSADDRDRVECILQTIVYEPELELLEAQGERMVTAIDGNGDAVVLSWNGVPTVLHDGTDPDDAPPEEGEVTSVDGVAVPFTGDEAWIGICCEPVAGSLLRTPIGTVATYDNAAAGFGHAPMLSPDDRYLAAIDAAGVQIRDLESDTQAVVDLQADVYQQASKLVWIASDVLAVQIDSDTERSIAFYSVVDGVASEISRTVISTGTAGAAWSVELVGATGPQPLGAGTEPLIWLWNREDATLVAHGSLNVFSGTMGEGVITRELASDATVVQVVGRDVRWVDESRILWAEPLDGSAPAEPISGGEYVWVG